MSRIKPCVNEINKNVHDTILKMEQNNAILEQNNARPEQNNAILEQNNAKNCEVSQKNTCQYCTNIFFNKNTLRRHEKTCKMKDDPCRLLEIEMGIQHKKSENLICYFCNKTLFRADSLTRHLSICKERGLYHEQLLKQNQEKEQKIIQQTINNGTINNGTINNGTINNTIVFNTPRSLQHIQAEKIIQFLRDLKQHHLPDQTYEKAGDLIIMMENYIQENEENKNFVIPDYKSVVGYIKNKEDWTVTGIENPLNQQFKETAGIIYEKRSDIENVNEKVFENNNNVEIFKHVKQFNNKGFGYDIYGDQKIKSIKSNYKITKLKNQNICDF